MIILDKQTKIKLLKAIRTGQFDGEQFPELAEEIKTIQIEIIDHSSQVIHDSNENKTFEDSENTAIGSR